MNEISTAPTLVPLTRAELVTTLANSLYPGARPASIELVLDYCVAARLDPVLKPVHIVPMWVEDRTQPKKDGKYPGSMRDVVMPGVGLYRINASRNGDYAGQDEPIFGPMRTLKINDFSIDYPEYAKVTVYKIVQGQRCGFTAIEFWLENYATASKDSDVPNRMWRKRVMGQIAKCAEAQALRRAWPEAGQAPTAEEMEGREWVDADEVVEVKMPAAKKKADKADKAEAEAEVADAVVVERSPAPARAAFKPAENPAAVDAAQVAWVVAKFVAYGIGERDQMAMVKDAGVDVGDRTKPVPELVQAMSWEQFVKLRKALVDL